MPREISLELLRCAWTTSAYRPKLLRPSPWTQNVRLPAWREIPHSRRPRKGRRNARSRAAGGGDRRVAGIEGYAPRIHSFGGAISASLFFSLCSILRSLYFSLHNFAFPVKRRWNDPFQLSRGVFGWGWLQSKVNSPSSRFSSFAFACTMSMSFGTINWPTGSYGCLIDSFIS